MNKGDIVLVHAETVCFQHYDHQRKLLTTSYANAGLEPIKGIVLGFSFLRTGRVTIWEEPYNYQDTPPYLTDIKDHKVWVVEPLQKGNRYLKPIRVLEENLEMIK